MFPYLRTKKEFLEDCETIGYRIVSGNNEHDYKLEKLDNIIKRDPKECRKEKCNLKIVDKVCCNHVSLVVGWLIERVNLANWGSDGGDMVGRVGLSKIKSWCNSVCFYLYGILKDEKISDDIMVGLEDYIDYSGEDFRVGIDVAIGGYSKHKKMNVFIIELKQWSKVKIKQGEEGLKWSFLGSDNNWSSPFDAPSHQLRSYCEKLTKAIEANKSNPINFIPCVYMHNLKFESIDIPNNVTIVPNNGVISDGEQFNNEDILYYLKGAEEAFGNRIADSLGGENCLHRDVFTKLKKRHKVLSISELADILICCKDKYIKNYYESLHPDQRVLLEGLKARIVSANTNKPRIDSANTNKPKIEIVYGAPGCGKTVIAMHLLRYGIDNNKTCAFVYSGAASANAILASIDECDIDESKKNKVKDMFISAKNLNGNDKTIIIFDELHSFFTRQEDLKNIINKTNIFIVFCDDLQRLSPNAQEKQSASTLIGKLEKLEKYDVRSHYKLWSQFRCGADEGYVTWVEQYLGIENKDDPLKKERDRIFVSGQKAAGDKIYISDLDFKPDLLDKEGVRKCVNEFIQKGEKLAIVTGKWGADKADFEKYFADLFGVDKDKIDNWTKPINDKKEGMMPLSPTQDGKLAIGSTEMVQGVEYDTALVIIGEELGASEHSVYPRNSSKYPAYWSKRKYRVLLTRGLKKCYIFCVDDSDDSMRKRFEDMKERPKGNK